MKNVLLFASLGLAFALAGCGGSKSHDHDHAGHDHEKEEHAHKGHVHTAPHGGVLVELGEHQNNVEWVRLPESGELSLYVLDAHAENFVRIAAPAVPVRLKVGSEDVALVLTAVANPATGETVGDTSQFTVKSDLLRQRGAWSGTIPVLDVKGTLYRDVAFQLPALP